MVMRLQIVTPMEYNRSKPPSQANQRSWPKLLIVRDAHLPSHTPTGRLWVFSISISRGGWETLGRLGWDPTGAACQGPETVWRSSFPSCVARLNSSLPRLGCSGQTPQGRLSQNTEGEAHVHFQSGKGWTVLFSSQGTIFDNHCD